MPHGETVKLPTMFSKSVVMQLMYVNLYKSMTC